ncbi:MAG: response regulator [Selenomonas sp.]|uniref:response regulator n=1 Tax=Selenomonas sp. TaxID=2053611 RepID=UPI0025FE0028|nr:response regulator [Selenomonas sp.]MCR5756677.1 response regulator [Selenomonas sp.]
MIQEHYELSLQAGYDSFKVGLSHLLEQKAVEMVQRRDCAVYIHLLFCMMDKEVAEYVRKIIHEVLPQAVVSGMSETIFGTDKIEVSLKLNFVFFQHSQVHLLNCDGCPLDYAAAGRMLGQKLQEIPSVRAAAIFAAGMSTEFHKFVRGFAQLNEEVVIFGSTAGMFEYSADDKENRYNLHAANKKNRVEQQYVIGEQVYTFGVVVVVFSGADLHVQGDYVFGWKPLGKEMTVTATGGENVIATVDDMPAAEIYRRYLKVTPDENFVNNISEFPIAIERNGFLMGRVPPRYDEEGKLFFSADVNEGEKLRLTYAVREDLLKGTERASEQMCAMAPNALFLIVCGNRTMFLKKEARKEIDFYRRFMPPLSLNYGTSEIFCHGGQGGVLNSALVAVGMREGQAQLQDFHIEFMQPQVEKHQVIPLDERMAAFLQAVTEELREMAHNAEAASIAKSQFLSNMSHEIRTPINAVLGMDEMILRESTEPNIRQYAENIRTAGTSLLGLINDILDFSKIEAGKLELIPVEYAVSSMLNDLVNMIRQRAEKKGLELCVEAPIDMPSILQGDEIRFRQVVTNLLTNAVKYTEKGRVTLALSYEKVGEDAINLRVSVQDTGIGIKEEDLEKLFHPFERIEEERNRTIEGTGLGMNITQRLLALAGRKLEVKSIYGEGSEFSFTVTQKVLNWEPMGNYEEAYRRSMAARTAYQESFIAPEAKIMVVDDTAMNLTVIRGLLKQTQVQVDTAMSGYECLKLAGEKHYDVIFLDHRMPGLDGVETLQQMKELSTGQDFPNGKTPVIALTANAVSGAREEYLAAGFDDYLTKPIDSHKLEELLRKYLPQDKVEHRQSAEVQQEADKLPDWLEYVVGLDPYCGVKHCGSVGTYMDALKVFVQNIESNAAEIQRYFEGADWKNYTTKVHALKSTARIIGAEELSARARRLEDAGNNGYVEEIKAGTKPLLELYRSYLSSLSLLLPQAEPAVKKEAIDAAELAEAWAAMGEAVQSFDYDNLGYMLEELDRYDLPAAAQEKLHRIREAASVPDWQALQILLILQH